MNRDRFKENAIEYNLAAIRALLLAAFAPEDLHRFCQDRPLFRQIVSRFGSGQGLDDMVAQVITYCEIHLLLEELLIEVRKANPRQYERLGPYWDEPRVRQHVVNLPLWDMSHSFKNRQVEIQAMHEYLRDDQVRMINIVGQGGMGKTALACYVSINLESSIKSTDAELGDEPRVDGILYLSTKTISSGLGLEHIYAGMEPMLDEPTARRLVSRWRLGEAPLAAKVEYLLEALQGDSYLILIDNLEDSLTEKDEIAEEGLRLFVEYCLTRPTAVRLIITSRQEVRLPPAGLASVRTIPLNEGLSEEDAIALLRELDPQGRLGLQKAPEDSLKSSTGSTQGIPLALELLAGFLAEDPTIRFDDLLADKTLLAEEIVNRMFGKRYERLSDDERRVMQIMSVFDRPVDQAAISFVLEPWFPELDIRRGLQRLVRQFIVTGHRARGEYSLHPLHQESTYRRLPVNENPDAYSKPNLELRAAEYYISKRKIESKWRTIEDLEPQLLEFGHRIRAEDYDNAGLLLESIDFDYLSMWGYASKLVELREKLIGRLTQPGLIANNLGNLGLSYHALGQIKQAKSCYEQALSVTREIPERQSEGIWLGDLGKAYQDQGQVEQAIVFYKQALAIAAETGDKEREGIWLGDLGDAYHDLGRFKEAVEFFEQALDIHQQVGDLRRVGAESGNLGSAYRALGFFERAIELYLEALRIARLVGDQWSLGVNLGRLGVAYGHLGKIGQAMEYHEEALSTAGAIGHRRIEGRQLGYLGDIYRLLGQTDSAIQFLNEALSIARDTDDRRFEGVWLHRLGAVYHDLGQIRQAITVQQEALEITRGIGDRRGMSYRLLGLGRLLLASSETEEAEDCLQEAQRLEASEPHARILLALGVVHLFQGTALAQEAFEESADLCRVMLERTSGLYEARFSLATALVGLAICDPQWTGVENREELLSPALEEYQSALEICAAQGIIRDALLDLQLIQSADVEGLESVFKLLEGALRKDQWMEQINRIEGR